MAASVAAASSSSKSSKTLISRGSVAGSPTVFPSVPPAIAAGQASVIERAFDLSTIPARNVPELCTPVHRRVRRGGMMTAAT
jgi:hypothetical protein